MGRSSATTGTPIRGRSSRRSSLLRLAGAMMKPSTRCCSKTLTPFNSASGSSSVATTIRREPLACATECAASAQLEKKGSAMLGMTKPIVLVRAPFNVRAAGFGIYPSLSMTRRTRARVSGLTLCPPLMTRDTVVVPTPALFATSLSVGCLPFFMRESFTATESLSCGKSM